MKNNESMIDVAEKIISDKKAGILFKDLYDEVALALEMNEEEKADRISDFYTDITLDGRFFSPDGASWDLAKHHTSDAKKKFRAADADVDGADDGVSAGDDEDADENLEYEMSVRGGVFVDDEEGRENGGDEESEKKEDIVDADKLLGNI